MIIEMLLLVSIINLLSYLCYLHVYYLGQGTIAVELLEQLTNLDAILVPVSGGGLISGIALYAKRINPNIRIYACVPEGKMLEECLKEEERLWPNPPQFLQTKCEGI